MTVSVVFPCLNEAGSVGVCVEDAFGALSKIGDGAGEVIVVDNGSNDGSDAIALKHGARVIYEDRPGYGSALRRGIAEAHGDIVVMADADCTYELGKIPDLVGPVRRREADLVLGERLDSASNTSMPILHRLVGTPVLSALVRRAGGGGLNVSDSQSGFRAFRRDTIVDLGLCGTGMEFASEMLIQAARQGLTIAEIPTQYSERVGESKLSTFSDGLRHLALIMLLAPSLVLKMPGMSMLTAGVIFTVLGFVHPTGIPVGSSQWHPVFLATILVVVGTLAFLAGLILERHSPVSVTRQYRFRSPFQSTTAAIRLAVLGLGMGVTGLGINIWLLVSGVGGAAGFETTRLAAAGLATSLIIVGMVCAITGVLGWLVVGQTSFANGNGLPWASSKGARNIPSVSDDQVGDSQGDTDDGRLDVLDSH